MLSDAGKMELTIYRAGAAAGTVAFSDSTELLNLLDRLPDPVVIGEDVFKAKKHVIREVLDEKPDSLLLESDRGAPAKLSLETRGGAQTIVVNEGKGLTFSPEAFKERDLLSRPIMAGLAARTRIIVLVDRTDQIQRLAYKAQFGTRARFVETGDELYSELAKAENRFVVTVGHVEGEHFVVRKADGIVSLKEPLIRIQQSADEAQSVGLQLGCNVATAAPLSGPTLPIDALELARALKLAEKSKTPQEFFERLSEVLGPIHLETDINGRLRAVSARPVGTVKNVLAADLVRGSVSRAARLPRTAAQILIPFSTWLSGIVIASWILLWLAENTRRHAWQTLEEMYAYAVHLELREVLPLTRVEAASLFLLGPSFYCVRLACMLILNGVMAGLGAFSIVTISLIGFCNPTALRETSATTRLNEWLYLPLRNARGANVLILCVAVPLQCIGSEVLDSLKASQTASTVLWALTLAAAGVALVLSRQRPWLLRGDELLLRAAFWPSDALFKLIALVQLAAAGLSGLWTPSTR